jgi:hypothetical protein
MDLLSYWNLAERPFETTWDVRFFFQSRDHDEALSRLGFLVGEQTMLIGMLTGEIGCGKTLTRAVFTDRLDRQRFRAVIQENSAFSFSDMLGSCWTIWTRRCRGEPDEARALGAAEAGGGEAALRGAAPGVDF